MPSKNHHLGKLAVISAKQRWGTGWSMLSPEAQLDAIYAEAARIVLQQAMPEYEPAVELLQAIIAVGAEATHGGTDGQA